MPLSLASIRRIKSMGKILARRAWAAPKRFADASTARATQVLTNVRSWLRRTHANFQIQMLNRWVVFRPRAVRLVGRLVIFGLVVMPVVILLLQPQIQAWAQPVLPTPRVSALQNALLNVGSQLIGISALVFALVTFALQVNLERMPYTLFARLTADRWLMTSFFGIFGLCVFIACLSMFIADSNAGAIALLALWALVAILVLIFTSFRRALLLVSPAYQLAQILSATRKDFDRWDRRAKLFAPLQAPNPAGVEMDGQRLAFFAVHRGWDGQARQALQHASAYVRHYANAGDIEVSSAAVTVIAKINAAYVKVKGKTFFASNLLMDNALVTDAVLNTTLEQLRQLADHGLQSNNETLAEQAMSGMAALVPIYNQIDYGRINNTKTHANLAASYLEGAIKAAIPRNMPDVVMQGARLLGGVGQQFVSAKAPTEAATVGENLGAIAFPGIVQDNLRPATQVAMQELAALTAALIASEIHDIKYAAGEIRDSVKLLTLAFLRVPSSSPISIHSTYLGPYHSMTADRSLSSRLTNLANAVIQADAGNPVAARIARNFEAWSDDLYRSYREMFPAAINAKSQLALDLAHTIEQLARVLLGVADAQATPDHLRDNLVSNAEWLIGTLTWVPDEAEAVQYAENYRITDVIIDFSIQTAGTTHESVWQSAARMLISWAYRTAKHNSRWGTPEKCLAAAAAILAFREIDDVPADITALLQRLRPNEQELPNERIQEFVQRCTEQYINNEPEGFALDRLPHFLGQVDRGRFTRVLGQVLAGIHRAPNGGVQQ